VGINPAAMGNPTGVTGQGGIGKTQLAVAYAYQYQEHYPDGVYWLNAAEGLWSAFAGLGRHFLEQGDSQALKARLWETLRSRFSIEEIRDLCLELGVNYEEFSPQLGISSLTRELIQHIDRRGQLPVLEAAVRRLRGELAETQAQDELVIHAFTWLRDRPRSLLILDNIADPTTLDKPLARDCVPGRLPSRVLFTTRRRELGHFRPVELKTLPPDAALELLLRDHHRQPVLDPSHSEHETARDICAVFGYLPLALEIAAAHLAKFHTAPLTIYRTELRRRGALDVIADERIATDTRHEAGLAAALEAQWATLGNEAQMLLRVAGQLSEAAHVPVARLGLLAGVPDEGTSFFDVTLAVALAQLQDASLIEELAGDQARLHPLVREFARDRTLAEEKATFLAKCVLRLTTAFSDIQTLERQCNERGIDALIYDLVASQDLLDGKMNDDTLRVLRAYLRVLRLEAHSLRGWRQSDTPSFLAQQLHLRLINSATPGLFGDLYSHLQTLGLTWRARWITRHESPRLEMTLSGSIGAVNALAVTPDGRQVIGCGYDSLSVWNLDTGATERRLTSNTGEIWTVAITPDGKQALTGGEKGLSIWSLDTGACVQLTTDYKFDVRAVAIAADGQRAVFGGADGLLRVWNLEIGVLDRILPGHAGMLLSVAITSDGRRVVSGGQDSTVRVWDLDSNEAGVILTDHEGDVWSVAVTPDGRRIVSGADDGKLLVWNLDTGQREKQLVGHEGWIGAIAVTQDGQWCISGGLDHTLRIWDLSLGVANWIITGHVGDIRAVAVTPDGGRAVSSGGDQAIRVWNLDTSAPEPARIGHYGEVSSVATIPQSQQAISAGEDHFLYVWNLDSGIVKTRMEGSQDWVQSVAVTADGQWAVSGGMDMAVRVWNLTRASVQVGVGHKRWVRTVAVTPDGRRAISGGREGIRVWSLDRVQVEKIIPSRGAVNSLSVTPNGQRIIYGGDDHTLRVWNLQKDEMEAILTGHMGEVLSVAVMPNGQWAVSGGSDRIVRIWNLTSSISSRTLTGHADRVRAVGTMPDRPLIVSGGDDRTLRLWDFHTGRELARAVLDAAVTCLAVTFDSPSLVIVGDAAGGVYCLEWVE
jgi:WD40 repeat protein